MSIGKPLVVFLQEGDRPKFVCLKTVVAFVQYLAWNPAPSNCEY